LSSGEAVDGVLIADKPRGPTSHDVVAQARRLYGTRQVGHAGTLDPMATGVLVLLFGQALKLSAYLSAAAKCYRGVVSFGRSTDTLDALGRTLEERPLPDGEPSHEKLASALALERERTSQEPPVFSAIKVAGRRAHRATRQGDVVELEPRPVEVFSLELLEVQGSAVAIELAVSKGYYVRALARDLGARMGLPAHLAELRRTASGPFTLAEAVTWPAARAESLIPLEVAVARALPTARLAEQGVSRARLGQRLDAADFTLEPASAAVSAWLGPAGELVALGEKDGARFRVVRGFTPSARVD
jgi:tRNA pseudouridine55 synthase